MDTHVKVLGVLNIVWGGMGLIGALIVFTVLGGTAGLVAATEQSEDALLAVSILSLLAIFVSILILVLSAPSVIIGVGLLKFSAWARVLGIVLSILHLISFPIGTALGAYGLWVLLNERSARLFDRTISRPVSV